MQHFKARMWDYLKISALTQKRVKGHVDSAIKKHFLFCNLQPNFVGFSFLTYINSYFKATLMESLVINGYHPDLVSNS